MPTDDSQTPGPPRMNGPEVIATGNVPGPTFTVAEIKEMVEDCTDRQGNLYRISFLNRLDHEAALAEKDA